MGILSNQNVDVVENSRIREKIDTYRTTTASLFNAQTRQELHAISLTCAL